MALRRLTTGGGNDEEDFLNRADTLGALASPLSRCFPVGKEQDCLRTRSKARWRVSQADWRVLLVTAF